MTQNITQTAEGIKIGDVFCSTLCGETDCNSFFEVVGISGEHSVKVREIRTERTFDDRYHQSGYERPVLHSYKDSSFYLGDKNLMTKRVVNKFGELCINITYYMRAYKVNNIKGWSHWGL